MTDEERAHEIAILAVGYIDGDLYGLVMRKVLDALATARAEERERCALVADGFSRFSDKPDHADAPKLIATAIRTAGDAPPAQSHTDSQGEAS